MSHIPCQDPMKWGSAAAGAGVVALNAQNYFQGFSPAVHFVLAGLAVDSFGMYQTSGGFIPPFYSAMCAAAFGYGGGMIASVALNKGVPNWY